MILTSKDRELIKKVKYAVEQAEQGDPVKDFIGEDDILEALELLTRITD